MRSTRRSSVTEVRRLTRNRSAPHPRRTARPPRRAAPPSLSTQVTSAQVTGAQLIGTQDSGHQPPKPLPCRAPRRGREATSRTVRLPVLRAVRSDGTASRLRPLGETGGNPLGHLDGCKGRCVGAGRRGGVRAWRGVVVHMSMFCNTKPDFFCQGVTRGHCVGARSNRPGIRFPAARHGRRIQGVSVLRNASRIAAAVLGSVALAAAAALPAAAAAMVTTFRPRTASTPRWLSARSSTTAPGGTTVPTGA